MQPGDSEPLDSAGLGKGPEPAWGRPPRWLLLQGGLCPGPSWPSCRPSRQSPPEWEALGEGPEQEGFYFSRWEPGVGSTRVRRGIMVENKEN